MGATLMVLCIHSFASSSRQYRGLASRLGVVAPDLYGHGERAAWSGEHPFTLADEAAYFEAFLPQEGSVHLVGHSYGAAVALHIAGKHRSRIRSMAGASRRRSRSRRCATIPIACSARACGLRRALRLLRETLPRADVMEFEGLGHLGPITHPTRVDEAVEAFIQERSQPWLQSHRLHTA